MARRITSPWRLPVLIAGIVLLAWLLRRVVGALAVQLGTGALLMACALPLCRLLERRMKPGIAAAGALLALLAGGALALALLLPQVIAQLRELALALPALLTRLEGMWRTVSTWLMARGVDLVPVQEELFAQLGSRAGEVVAGVGGMLRRMLSGVGNLLPAPLLAFYLLRDRKRISAALMLLLPIPYRAQGVRAAREMRRETAAYMRGQLALSLAVGALTAFALLLTGTPGWLMLGMLMGVMELIPYAGPVIAGVPAVLLSLQNGWQSALWTLLALMGVQQLEGAVLSPRLLGGATQLHPMAVLLLIPAGGILLGPLGMVAILPAVVALRGALRGWRT